MKRISANRLTFMVGIAGTGPRLLFLTGSSGDLRNANTPLKASLTRHFEVLTFDQRGMGQSDKPDLPYTMRDYAQDAAAILDAVGWEAACVAGYSFGGMVAQELALGWPERVTRLALVATTAGGKGGASYPIHELDALAGSDRARRGLEITDLSFTPEWQAAHPEEAKARIDAKMATGLGFAAELGAATGRRQQLAARAAHDTYDRLPWIAVPTLVLGGRSDGQAPLAPQKAMAQRIPGSRFEEIDGTHEMLWRDDAIFARIARFFSEPAG
uniref:alpha/beta fold hydrolase n=1 Tax=Pararhizobium sp. IMCC3301 TaxID=3067904 RepID=UPI0027425CFD|nr:alpha/beta fold hydrolase [Pararhizobium sp. IMCC3301]